MKTQTEILRRIKLAEQSDMFGFEWQAYLGALTRESLETLRGTLLNKDADLSNFKQADEFAIIADKLRKLAASANAKAVVSLPSAPASDALYWNVTRWCCSSGDCIECHHRRDSGIAPLDPPTAARVRVRQAAGVSRSLAEKVAEGWSVYDPKIEPEAAPQATSLSMIKANEIIAEYEASSTMDALRDSSTGTTSPTGRGASARIRTGQTRRPSAPASDATRWNVTRWCCAAGNCIECQFRRDAGIAPLDPPTAARVRVRQMSGVSRSLAERAVAALDREPIMEPDAVPQDGTTAGKVKA